MCRVVNPDFDTKKFAKSLSLKEKIKMKVVNSELSFYDLIKFKYIKAITGG